MVPGHGRPALFTGNIGRTDLSPLHTTAAAAAPASAAIFATAAYVGKKTIWGNRI